MVDKPRVVSSRCQYDSFGGIEAPSDSVTLRNAMTAVAGPERSPLSGLGRC